ncbi:MAG TPA: 6,7-dimethyl-8-ribityllumazine synthase [bacterium]|nr:6,7-dimethyl-8-ribityllumazine synthase [bacterium]
MIRQKPEGKGLKVGMVVSRFNGEITAGLLEGAMAALARAGVDKKDLLVASVPGAWEIPFALRAMLETRKKKKRLDCLIALGAVIRGETAHFEYVSAGAIEGCAAVEREYGVPVALGILTTENESQAISRSSGKDNKGIEAAEAALEMANLARALKKA